MAVAGDDIWNSVMKSVEADATGEMQGQVDQEMATRDAAQQKAFPGDDPIMQNQRELMGAASRVGDAANAAASGVLETLFQTKDFLTGGATKEENKSQFRKDAEKSSRELKALSKWNGAVESVSNFVTGFIGAGRLMGAAGIAKGGFVADTARAAGVGFVAMDPQQERLSNLVESMPALRNPVTDALAAKPDDSRTMGRLKNAVESIVMDTVAAGAIVAAVKVVKFTRSGDVAAAKAAQAELDAANIKLGQQELDHHRKSFITEEDTKAAQADLLNREITAAEPQGGLGKDFLGDAAITPGPAAAADNALGGRAAALDAEMRAAPDNISEVPGGGSDGPIPPTEGMGGRAGALDAELRASGDPEVQSLLSKPQGVADAPATVPPPVEGRPLAGGPDGAGSDVRPAATVPDAGAGAPIREGVEQVPRGDASGMRRVDEAPKPEAQPVTPQQVERYVAASRKDDIAVQDAGSVEAALQDGHKFASAGTVPWQKIGETPDGLRSFIAEVVDLNSEAIGRARGGVEGVLRDTKVEKLADQLGSYFNIDPSGYMGQLRQAGDAARAMVVQTETAMRISKAAFNEAYLHLRRIDAGNFGQFGSKEEALAAFSHQVQLATEVYSQARAMQTSAGRTLRRTREEFAVRGDQMAKVNIAQMDPENLANLFRATEGNADAMAKATRPSFLAQAVDAVNVFRMANMLWGWSTQVVNTASNVSQLAFRPLTQIVGSHVQEGFAAITKNEALANTAKIVRRQAKIEAVSTAATISDGLQAFKKAFILGDSIMAPHNSTEAFEALAGGVGGRPNLLPWRDFQTIDDVIANGIKALTYTVTADLRLMGAADEMVKTMRYRAVLMGRAAAEAEEAGLKSGSKAFKDFIKAKADAGFDDMGRAIDADALKEAKVTTFQQDLKLQPEDTWGGYQTLGQATSNFTANYPVAKMILPFVKTPSNLFRYGVKLTPGLNLLQKEYLNALRGAHGEAAQATAMGQMSMGIMLMAAGVQLRMQDKITGSGPRDPKQAKEWKNQGNLPYAIRLGEDGEKAGMSFQINRFDPIQFPVALAADFVDMVMIASNKGEKDQMDNAAMAGILALAHQLKDKTYYKGASDFLDALGDDKKMASWTSRFAPGFIPGAALLKSINPDPYVREVHGLLDSIKATLPGYSEDVPKRIDALGNAVTVPGRFIGTKDYSSPLNAALDEMYAMTGTSLTAPNPKVDGVELRGMTLKNGRDAYEYYSELAGKPAGQQPLKQALEKLVQTGNYKAAPHGEAGTSNTKEFMVSQVINSYRAAAMAQMKNEDATLRETLGAKARDSFNKAMAGKKDLKSVEASETSKALNALLKPTGVNTPILPTVPQQ